MKKKVMAIATFVMSFVTSLLMMVPAYADPVTNTTSQIIQTGVTSLQSEIMGIIAVVVPVAFAITAAVIGIKFGIRFVRSLVKG
jgi:hypothetical protein